MGSELTLNSNEGDRVDKISINLFRELSLLLGQGHRISIYWVTQQNVYIDP